jgi:hypothetical protein
MSRSLVFIGMWVGLLAPDKDGGEGLIWMGAFDQSGRTDDAIIFPLKPGQEPRIVGFGG